MSPRHIATSALITLMMSQVVSACPYCDSDTGRRVAAAIFADDFWRNLLVGAAPFPVLLGIVAMVQFSGQKDD